MKPFRVHNYLASAVLCLIGIPAIQTHSAEIQKGHTTNQLTKPSSVATSPEFAEGLPIEKFEAILKKLKFEVPAEAFVRSASAADIEFSNASRECKHKESGTLLDYTIVESNGRITMKYYTAEVKRTPDAVRVFKSVAESISPEMARKLDEAEKEHSKTQKECRVTLGKMTITVDSDNVALRCDLPQKKTDKTN